jgi:hypothetical protein
MPRQSLYPMSSDPRVHKPRLPKAYTDPQITYLKRLATAQFQKYTSSSAPVLRVFVCGGSCSNLPEFERRSQGSIRGDAKKFALERAADFIARFGLPDEFIGAEDSESRFREVRSSFFSCW